jgi:hypothetical protein
MRAYVGLDAARTLEGAVYAGGNNDFDGFAGQERSDSADPCGLQ